MPGRAEKVEYSNLPASDGRAARLRPMSERDWVAIAASLAERFAERAAEHDREGSFPHENFAELREAGFMKLTVPRSHGGFELPLSRFVRVQEALAQGDGSTALSLNMHLIRFGAERESHLYPPEWFEELCRGAVEEGRLVNTAATEEGLGSPAGGGVPETTATPVEGGWVLAGRKTFVTLAPELWYMPVLARLDSPDGGPPDIADFMVLRDDPGIRIDETWDALGMRASGSHDLVLEGVRLGEDRFLGYRNRATPSPRGRASGVWFALGVAATTTGVARAARDYAVDFARTRTPTGLRAIAEFPGVRRRIARIDILLQRNHALIADAAAAWESGEDEGMPAADRVAVAKVDALNNAIEAVDEAMRVVGGVSLQKQRPIERYYRDVRAGLHNPPLEDRALEQLARRALDD